MEALKTSLPSVTSGLIIKFLILPEGEDPDTLINRESSKAFSKRIEDAQTLSSFLIDHIKEEVPFDTIEGKTLFLEKSASLINLVNYSIYRQQLIEGIANAIGQNIIQVEKAVEQNKNQNPHYSNTNQAEHKQFSPQPISQTISNKSHSSMKSLMSRMISCVLTYPSIVNDPETTSVIEERARKLPKV
jgi:DNA primase